MLSQVDLLGKAASVWVKLFWLKKCPVDISWARVLPGGHLWAQTKVTEVGRPESQVGSDALESLIYS